MLQKDLSVRRSIVRVAILYPTDPAGHVPSGIASFIRGVLKYAPGDIEYDLIGSTCDPVSRPLGERIALSLNGREVRYIPVVSEDPSGSRTLWPLTARYLWALRQWARAGRLDAYDILDFHRIEPVSLFTRDPRPKNVVLHNDMSVLRNPNSDIMWRHAPWLYEALERRLFQHADRVFCVRQTAVERYVASYPELHGRVAFIPTWVDTGVFKPAELSGEYPDEVRSSVCAEVGLNPRARLLISVGRLDRQKDPLLLIEAFRATSARIPDLHLLLVGDGVLRKQVNEACESSGLQDRVSILGTQPAAKIARLLQASELFVMSSAYEGMPIALLEALATGTPVVTTDVGEVRLVVRDGINGYIATPRTSAALADAIGRGLQESARLHGDPCTKAVEPYHPQLVLQQIYDNHRRQVQNLAA